MRLIEIIDRTRNKWRIELKECQDATLATPKAKSNPLDRMVLEYDYLLVEAKLALAKMDEAKPSVASQDES